MNTSKAWYFIRVCFFIIVSLFCINIVEVHAQENGTHSFVELLTGKAKRDKEWYRVDAPPFYSWMWRHSPKLHPFNRVLWEIGTGFRYKYIDETHKINRSDSIFYSIIDSLNVIDYDNDTIYLFQYDNQYLLENRSHNVTKSDHWTFAPNRYPRRDSLVYREKDSLAFRVDWLPMYVRNTLIEDNIDFLSKMCKWSEFEYNGFESQYYPNKPYYILHKIIISNGKVILREKITFKLHFLVCSISDYIYDESKRLNEEGHVLDDNSDKKHNYKDIGSQIASILDSVYNIAPYYEILKDNRKILKWEKENVIPLLDSLQFINFDNDTVYYELCYGKNGRGNNRASILSNLKRMYVYQSFDNIVWDTLSGEFREKYWGSTNLDELYRDEMQDKYVLYTMPFGAPLNLLLYNLTRNLQEMYDYDTNSFRYDKRTADYMIVSPDNIRQSKRIFNRKDGMVRIISRIELKDGKVVKVATQMRIGKFNIWTFF
ncbi:MAG: hypothetical protein IKC67_04160 [Odoribacter sp.]|nr:hypothetical protein [Odoribacter sp.]